MTGRFNSVLAKIWLGVIIVFIGYGISMWSFHAASQSVLTSIKAGASSQFPVTRLSHELLSEFSTQNRLFNDAVLLGDAAKIDEAMSIAASMTDKLDKMAILLNKDERVFRKLKEDFKPYFENSAEISRQMADGNSSDQLYLKAGELAKQRNILGEALLRLDQKYADYFLQQLKNTSVYLNAKLKHNLVLFFVVLLICSLLINSILKKLIMQPLQQLTTAANEMKNGNSSHEILFQSGDEIGILAEAFRQVARSQQQKAELAESIAAGNLTGKAAVSSEHDRLGLALEQMTFNLNEMITEIRNRSDFLVEQSDQVAQANEILSEGAVESAASLEEISGAIIEIERQTANSAENSRTSREIAEVSFESIARGNVVLGSLIALINRISASSGQIAKVIKMIDDIAFQTNLLALNAAVEAARAGTHGRGFAVVADEVRNLAGRSAKAAKETSDLISGSIAQATEGKDLAGQAEKVFKEIAENVARLKTLVSEISQSAQEQATAMHQVKDGLHQIDGVIQQNASRAEETSAVAQEMVHASSSLQKSVSRFKI